MAKQEKNQAGRLSSILIMILVGMMVITIQSATFVPSAVAVEVFTEEPPEDSVIWIKVLTAGDAMAHLPQTQAAYNTETKEYSYYEVFRWISPFVKVFDISIINLETTLAGEPYRGYPQFSAPDSYAADLHKAGFNLFCLANNHSVDRYNKGIIRTIDVLDSLGICHTGTFKDKIHRDTAYPLMLDRHGIRIAVINATYGTNGLNPKAPAMVNMINREEIAGDILKARDKGADVIIASIHWGDEYKRFPNTFQKSIAQFLADNGVDVIVGHHPHVLQPVEWIKGNLGDSVHKDVFVIWSLGNFFSNQRDRYRDGGMFVNFDIVKNKNSGVVTIENPTYYPYWVWRSTPPFRYSLLPASMRDSLVQHYSLTENETASFGRSLGDTEEHISKNGVVRLLRNVTNSYEIIE